MKITNGVDIFEVTKGAFTDIYSKQGFYAVKEVKHVEPAVDVTDEGEDEEVKWTNELLEKPISQWKKEEIKRFADFNGIDISGTKNANEAKGLIKEFLDIQAQELLDGNNGEDDEDGEVEE